MGVRGVGFLRRAGINIALLVVASVVALGAGEVAIRVIAPQQLILLRPDLWQPMDSVGWAHRPNVHSTVNTGDRTVGMHTDSSGFRVAASGRPPGRYRVLLLGDSFMAAMQVEYEQSLAGLVDRCFAARTGQSAVVWNTGVSGWDPPQYYVQARRVLSQAPFDLVLVSVFLGNDVVHRRFVSAPREPEPRRSLRFPRRFSTAEFIDAWLAPINDGLETRSHLFIFFKTKLQTLLMQAGLTAVEVPTELRRSEANSPRWGLTADILADIDSLGKSRGIPTLFALVPSIEQVVPSVLETRTKAFHLDSAALDIEQPTRLMSGELARRGLDFVSLLEPLREAQARGVVLYGRADPHPSADGHRVMWNAVAPRIAARLGLPYQPGNGAPAADCDPP